MGIRPVALVVVAFVVLTSLAETNGGVAHETLRVADAVVQFAFVLLAIATAAGRTLLDFAALVAAPFLSLWPLVVLAGVALTPAGALDAVLEADAVLFLAVAAGTRAVDVRSVLRGVRIGHHLD